MNPRSFPVVAMALAMATAGLAGCHHRRPPRPETVGRLQTVYFQNVTVDGTVVTSAVDLAAGATLSSDANGQFGFTLAEKVKQCRSDPTSKLQVKPPSGELVHFVRGTSYCTTANDPQVARFTAGDVVMTMTDPTFAVEVSDDKIVVKVVQGELRVARNSEPVTVSEGEEITFPLRAPSSTSPIVSSTISVPVTTTPAVVPRPVAVQLAARERCLLQSLHLDRSADCPSAGPSTTAAAPGTTTTSTTTTTITKADTVPPSVPAGLHAAPQSGRPCYVKLTWTAASDNVGVDGYTVYRSGQVRVTVTGGATTFLDSPPAGRWTYTVDAVDRAGNHSARSAGVLAAVDPCSN